MKLLRHASMVYKSLPFVGVTDRKKIAVSWQWKFTACCVVIGTMNFDELRNAQTSYDVFSLTWLYALLNGGRKVGINLSIRLYDCRSVVSF